MKTSVIKKVPMRKCVITGNQFPKKDLLRVVREPDGKITLDDTGKVRGHGVYLCKDETVIKQGTCAARSNTNCLHHSLPRSLGMRVPTTLTTRLGLTSTLPLAHKSKGASAHCAKR